MFPVPSGFQSRAILWCREVMFSWGGTGRKESIPSEVGFLGVAIYCNNDYVAWVRTRGVSSSDFFILSFVMRTPGSVCIYLCRRVGISSGVGYSFLGNFLSQSSDESRIATR